MPHMITVKISLTLEFRVPEEILERHLPASPDLVGGRLAEQIHAYSKAHKLGYFPALEFFRLRHAEGEKFIPPIDAQLLESVHSMAWFGGNLIQEEIRTHLRGAFTNTQIESLQCLAFTMPSVRFHRGDAIYRLAVHFTPVWFRATLLISILHPQDEEAEPLVKTTRHKVLYELEKVFEEISITSAQVVT